MRAQIVQSKWKTLKHSDGAELAWEMTLPHPITLSRQKGLHRQGGGEGQRNGRQGQSFTRAVKVGFTTLWHTCCKNEIQLMLGFRGQILNEKINFLLLKHLQTQQDQQGNVVHATLHPLLQRHSAAAVSIDRSHHVLQNLMKWHFIVIRSAHTFYITLESTQCKIPSCLLWLQHYKSGDPLLNMLKERVILFFILLYPDLSGIQRSGLCLGPSIVWADIYQCAFLWHGSLFCILSLVYFIVFCLVCFVYCMSVLWKRKTLLDIALAPWNLWFHRSREAYHFTNPSKWVTSAAIYCTWWCKRYFVQTNVSINVGLLWHGCTVK